jgi:hypothetical protein
MPRAQNRKIENSESEENGSNDRSNHRFFSVEFLIRDDTFSRLENVHSLPLAAMGRMAKWIFLVN